MRRKVKTRKNKEDKEKDRIKDKHNEMRMKMRMRTSTEDEDEKVIEDNRKEMRMKMKMKMKTCKEHCIWMVTPGPRCMTNPGMVSRLLPWLVPTNFRQKTNNRSSAFGEKLSFFPQKSIFSRNIVKIKIKIIFFALLCLIDTLALRL